MTLTSCIDRAIADSRNSYPPTAPVLPELKDVRIEIKAAIFEKYITRNRHMPDILALFRKMEVGDTPAESALRQRVLKLCLEYVAVGDIAKKFTHFNPSPSDAAVVAAIGEKVAKAGDDSFIHFYRLAAANTGSSADANKPAASFKLSRDTMLDLVKLWLLSSPTQSVPAGGSHLGGQAGNFQIIERSFGSESLFEVAGSKIPEFMRELHQELDPVQKSSTTSTWLAYSAAHLLGMEIPVHQSAELAETYRSLLLSNDSKLMYAGSQIIGKAMQNDGDAKELMNTLQRFNDKTVGVLFYAANAGNPSLTAQVSKTLNDAGAGEREVLKRTISRFSSFAGSDLIYAKTKHRLLVLLGESLSKTESPLHFCIETMDMLGSFGEIINHQSSPGIGSAYNEWLSKCDDLASLKTALNPDRKFLMGLLEMQIVAANRTAGDLLTELRSPNPMKYSVIRNFVPISNSDVIGLLRKAIRVWVAENDRNDLQDKQVFVEDLFKCDAGRNSIFQVREVLNNLPQLYSIYREADEADSSPLLHWAIFTGILMLDAAQETRESEFFKDMLSRYGEYGDGNALIPATICLYLSIRDQEVAEKFESFAKQFKAKRAQVFSAPLFVLSDFGKSPDGIASLTKLIGGNRIRDFRKAEPLLSFISELALVKTIDSNTKCRIANAVIQGIDQAKFPIGITREMNDVISLAKLVNGGSDKTGNVQAALNAIHSGKDAISAERLLFSALYSVPEAEIEEFAENYERYFETARDPMALQWYATSITTDVLDAELRDAARGEVAVLAKCLVADKGGELNNKVRNDTEKNEHIAFISSKKPEAWKLWQEEMNWDKKVQYTEKDLESRVDPIEFLRDRFIEQGHLEPDKLVFLESVLYDETDPENALSALNEMHGGEIDSKQFEKDLLEILARDDSKKNIAAALKSLRDIPRGMGLEDDLNDLVKKLEAPGFYIEKINKLQASISSKLEDLFMTGTEVGGSCQSVYAGQDYKIGLPGYALDGKHLSAQITNETGRIMWRRMLRFLWSEQENKPIVYVEREYENPGVPEKLKHICLQLVVMKAGKMGALLATDDESLMDEDGEDMGPLHAYRSPRAHEYVDALGDLKMNGEYTISGAMPMKRQWAEI